MIIKGYSGVPLTFSPDIGEIVLARRNPVDRWTRAAVTRARRNNRGNLKLTVWWLEDDPHAGVAQDGRTRKPIKAHTIGYIEVRRGPGVPPLIKQITRDTSASD
jgi:hypothetical protein